MSVTAKSVAVNGGLNTNDYAAIGMGLYSLTTGWLLPNDATGRLVVRATGGGVTFGAAPGLYEWAPGSVDHARIMHSGSGEFSLLSASDLDLDPARLDLADHTGTASIVSQGGLAVSGGLGVGGDLVLVSGWDEADGWTGLSFGDASAVPWTIAHASFDPAAIDADTLADKDMSLDSLSTGGALTALSGGDLTLYSAVYSGGTGWFKARGDLALALGTGQTIRSGVSDASRIALLFEAGGKFLNTSAAQAGVLSSAGGKWLAWIGDPAASVAGGLGKSAAMRQYGVDGVAYDQSSGALVLHDDAAQPIPLTLAGSGFLLNAAAPVLDVAIAHPPSADGNNLSPLLLGSTTDDPGSGAGSSTGPGTPGGPPSLPGGLGDSINDPDGFGDIVNTDNINPLQPPSGSDGSSGSGGGSTGSGSGSGSFSPGGSDWLSGPGGGSPEIPGGREMPLGDSGLSIVFVPSAPSGADSGEGSDFGSSDDGDMPDWFYSSSTLLTRGQWQALVGIEDEALFADRANALWRGSAVHPDDEGVTALGLTLDEVVRLYLPLLARYAPAGYEFDAEVVPLDDEEGEWGVRLTLRRKA